MGRMETGIDQEREYYASHRSRTTMVNDPNSERALQQALKKAYMKSPSHTDKKR